MLAQQQNPHAVSYSLQQQQVDSKEINSEGEADVKTFSIRQYVFACRQRSLLQSWPFPEKYLQMCFDRGLRNVLPPFGLLSNDNISVSESSSHNNGIPNLNDDPGDQEEDYDDKNVRVLKPESSLDHHHHDPLDDELQKKQDIMNHNSDYSGLLSNDEERSKAMMMMMTNLQEEEGIVNNKNLNCSWKSSSSGKSSDRRRRKGRCKKKSMADILAVARRCSLEEIYRINQFSYAAATENFIEGYYHETAPLDHENDHPKRTAERDDHELAGVDVNVT